MLRDSNREEPRQQQTVIIKQKLITKPNNTNVKLRIIEQIRLHFTKYQK